MSVRLLVTGADSQHPTNDWLTIFMQYETLTQAATQLNEYAREWREADFHQTPADIFVKGSVWRRAVVIDEHGVQWFPVQGRGE